MILEFLMNLISKFLGLIFNVVHLPSFEPDMIDNVGSMIDLIVANGSSLIGLFVRWNTVKILLPIVIAVVGFKYIYGLIMWVLRKIPMLGIS